MKMYVVQIGYAEFAMELEDAFKLMDISKRAIRLEGYPIKVAEIQDPLCERLELREVAAPAAPREIVQTAAEIGAPPAADEFTF